MELRGAAKALFACRDPEVLLDGPAGTGKTLAALWYMHLLAANNPGFRGLIARKTRVSLMASAIQTLRRYVLAEAPLGAVRHGATLQEPEGWTYPNGSALYIGGLDRDSKVMSTEYDAVFVNEATELALDDWEAIISRLRAGVLSYQQIVADCNPQAPTHWLNQRAEARVTTRLFSRHEDNPRYFTAEGVMTADGTAYIAGKLDRLTGVRYQRLRLGKWVAAEGQVYEAWRNDLHVVTRAAVRERLATAWHFGTVDWGWTHPGVLQAWAVDDDGRLYLEREVYMTRRPVEGWWVPRAQQLTHELGITAWVCDPSEPAYIAQFNAAGLYATAAENAIMPGITAVQNRLAPEGDDRPRLFILDDCLSERDEALVEAGQPWSTLQEIPEYVWPKDISGRPVKDRPVDANNHGLDCLRYACARLDLEDEAVMRPASGSLRRYFTGLPR